MSDVEQSVAAYVGPSRKTGDDVVQGSEDGVEAKYLGRRQVIPMLVCAAFAVVAAIARLLDRSAWWMLLVVAEFAGFSIFRVVFVVRSSRSGRALRLDETALTVRGADPVPWSDLERVSVGAMRPPLPRVVSFPWIEILAFHPRNSLTGTQTRVARPLCTDQRCYVC